MNPDKYAKAKHIFSQATEMEAAGRKTYLAKACADDPELRELVDSLLEADRVAEQFLEKSPLELVAGESAQASLAGKRIGPYRIVRGIGSGGMGRVYLAVRDDDQFKRQVAMKIIKRGMDSEEILRRFRTERQILATLAHPNIARLLDGGVTEEGLPYFVMEYIQGQPIDEYCDHHKLTTRERLLLFRNVCAAVQYAHQNLIVHRDLKPSNILVGTDGEPKLLDFGIAKLLNPNLSPLTTPMTATMLQVMTPEYASPEQVRGEPITTASDVYSLGVLLYELLTGHRPYRLKSRAPQEIEQTICEEEPLKPSTVITRVEEITRPDGSFAGKITPQSVSQNREGKPEVLHRRLAGDIDNIVLMALRKEPQRRYASVERFSEDIRRHIIGLPVFARKDTAWYRSSRFIKRHKVGVVATALIIISLLAGVIGTAWQAKVAGEERDRARLEAQKAEQVSQFLVNLFKVSDPSISRGDAIPIREILERGAQKIETELKGQPAVRANMADVIGKVYQSLGLYKPAAHFIKMGLRIRQELFRGDHQDLAESYQSWAGILNAYGEYAEAQQAAQKALDIRSKPPSENHAKIAESLNTLAEAFRHQSKYPEAEPLYRRALEIYETSLGADHPETATSLNNLAALLREQGRYAEAESFFRRALEIVETQLGADHLEVAAGVNNLAVLLRDEGRYAEAEPLYRRALGIYETQLGADHPHVAKGLNNLALLLRDQNRYSEAEALFRRALKINETQLGKKHPDVATSLNNLGLVLRDQGRYGEAEPLHRRALAIDETQLGPGHPYVATSLNNLALLQRDQGRYREAESLFYRALEIREAQLGSDHPDVASTLSGLAKLYESQGKYSEAEPLYKRVLEIRKTRLGENHPRTEEASRNYESVLEKIKVLNKNE